MKKAWTKKECIIDAGFYSRKVDWRFASPKIYAASVYNGWYEECCMHMMSSEESYKIGNMIKSKWDKEKCKEDALRFDSRANWYYGSQKGYSAALRNGWLEDCCGHMLSNYESASRAATKYSREDCYKKAKQFDERNQWCINHNGTYNAARRYGILEDCCKHMKNSFELISIANSKTTKAECLIAAKKYKTKMEWKSKDPQTYEHARKKEWYKEAVMHMPEYSSGEQRESKCYVLYENLLNKNKITFQKEVYLSENSRIEFVINTSEGKFGIEIKHDETNWGKKHIHKQLTKYSADGLKMGLKGIILSSPKGKYGCSLKSLKKAIESSTLSLLIF